MDSYAVLENSENLCMQRLLNFSFFEMEYM